MAEKDSMVFYYNWLEMVKKLNATNPSPAGNLVVAMFEYSKTGEMPDLPELSPEWAIFNMALPSIDKNEQRYKDMCQKRSDAGKKSAEQRAKKPCVEQNEQVPASVDFDSTQVNKSQQVLTSVKSNEQTATNSTDNDNEPDNEPDNDNEPEYEHENVSEHDSVLACENESEHDSEHERVLTHTPDPDPDADHIPESEAELAALHECVLRNALSPDNPYSPNYVPKEKRNNSFSQSGCRNGGHNQRRQNPKQKTESEREREFETKRSSAMDRLYAYS